MTHQVCIHSNDKSYQLQEAAISSGTFSEATIANPNALGGKIWGVREITWKCETGYEWLTTEQIDTLIKNAFKEASLRTPLKITKKSRKTSDAHIVINWLSKKDEPYFKSDSTLAFGYGPGKGLGGNITMNADVLWLLRTGKLYAEEAKRLGYIDNFANPKNVIRYYDPQHTMTHEGGHALGMNHITDLRFAKTDIMYPIYNALRVMGSNDITYLQALYGKAKISKAVFGTILDRIQSFGH